MATRKSIPEWARSIRQLRQRLGLSQTALGARLHYSAMAVSRWESGAQEPPAQSYIQLGNLAGQPQCWEFWARAGLKSSDITRMLPESRAVHTAKFSNFDVVMAGGGRKIKKIPRKIKLVAIPVLSIHAGTRGERGSEQLDLNQVQADQMLAAPAMWCPNPADTHCLVVKGLSMSPLISDGDIIAVDASQSDPAKLSGKIVVAWHRETGLSVARLLVANGVHLLESENREYSPLVMTNDRNWRLIGKVIWWIRQAP